MNRLFPIFISSVIASAMVGLTSEVFATNLQKDSSSNATFEWVACGGGGGAGAKKRAAREAMMKELQQMQEEAEGDED